MKINRKAFTLAEVLVTLAIIGVVAALIVPAMVKNIDKVKNKNAFKKIYSDIAQAHRMMMADGILPLSSSTNNPWPNYLKVNKSCTDSTAQGCFHTNGNWKNVCGNSLTSGGGDPGFITLKGTLFMNIFSDAVPVGIPLGFHTSGATHYTRTYLLDVNGWKGPNQLGNDIFALNLFGNQIFPVGADALATLLNAGSSNTCPSSCTSTSWRVGLSCAAKVLKNEYY